MAASFLCSHGRSRQRANGELWFEGNCSPGFGERDGVGDGLGEVSVAPEFEELARRPELGKKTRASRVGALPCN